MSLVEVELKIINKEVACHASVVKLLNADLEESRMESLFFLNIPLKRPRFKYYFCTSTSFLRILVCLRLFKIRS